MSKEKLFNDIKESVIEMEEEEVLDLCKEALDKGIPAYEIITDGLIKGMDEVSRLFEEEEYFLPEVLICSDAFNGGLDIVKPYLDKNSGEKPIKIVMGVVEGDTHDIGKNLVKIMMESAGFEVHDLGRDVPLDKFIETAEEIEADIIGMSTLMTTTMDGMKTVIDKLSEKGIRDKYKVMIGGGPISQHFANMIGADLYTSDASEAARKAKELVLVAQ
ncbi:dimethylamine corrinoid protein MtbC [Gottschalkia acidurici 9a]|uniref:Dimethylamine corrinoid protein MtbC n=1 Tax=Gottschalkia acidurici (strain ATCC 7906 / DSM 604 / BCRC 14475 / CIP 104303 / KCTC 5404 / NCIMB 10678 / 9a) TaxID=1128398 RepID=K0AY53_GOTA9|nr:corrinoid protein [Gottschalkia acidurici]AFS78169.1 dimethylamine corrinoid protein MtbC [Gottschalkia acidurici 9a]